MSSPSAKRNTTRNLGEPETPAALPFTALATTGYGMNPTASAYGIITTPEGFKFGPFTMTAVGLNAPATLNLNDWETMGSVLGKIEGALQWWIGDWLMLGDKSWGIKYERAMEITGFSYKYLRNIASITRKYDLSFRKDKLSFAHHLVAAALPPERRSQLLNQAEVEGWSVAQLRESISPRPGANAEYKEHQKTFHAILEAIKTNNPQAISREHLAVLRQLVAQIEQSLNERKES